VMTSTNAFCLHMRWLVKTQFKTRSWQHCAADSRLACSRPMPAAMWPIRRHWLVCLLRTLCSGPRH
ncbi:hypothetical protein LPJ54_000982, partial [Coemansia sp. RSA 1824]